MNRLVWLASYPKSGNTWFRALLSNVTGRGTAPVDINRLSTGSIASCRNLFEEMLGVSASDLTHTEIEALRPAVYRALAARAATPLYLKTHDAFTATASGEMLFPPDVSAAAIYIVRNPLDVAISFAHHSSASIDDTIARMADPCAALSGGPKSLHAQLRQRMLTWSGHVLSWIDQTCTPVFTIRYEDLQTRPEETLARALEFLRLEFSTEQIRRAIENSTFSALRAQEEEHGFRERPPRARSFFRKGISGEWREKLTPQQVERMVSQHGETMNRLGYTDHGRAPREA